MNFSDSEEQDAIRELSRQILGDACKHERLAELERDPAGDGDREPHRDPERDTQLEENGEQHKDENETHPSVADHHVQAIAQVLRVVVPNREFDSGR